MYDCTGARIPPTKPRLFKIRIVKATHYRYPHIPVWRMEMLDGRLVAYWQKANNKEGYFIQCVRELIPYMPALQRLTRFYKVSSL